MGSVEDATTLGMYDFLESRLRASYSPEQRELHMGLAIRRIAMRWSLSHLVETSARHGNLITDPGESDRNFACQIATDVLMQDPDHPKRGFGAASQCDCGPHVPNPSRKNLAYMFKLVECDLEETIQAAVSHYREIQHNIVKKEGWLHQLAPTRSLSHEENSHPLERWNYRNLGRLVVKISLELMAALGGNSLFRDQLIYSVVNHEHQRFAASEVPENALGSFRGRGKLKKQVLHTTDSYGTTFVYVKMREGNPREGVKGLPQIVRHIIPFHRPSNINEEHILDKNARPFISRLRKFISAPSLTPVVAPTIATPEATAFLIHECLAGHVICAEEIMNRESALLPSIGNRIFRPSLNVDIFDDATGRRFGSYRRDREGTRGQRTQIVKGGRLAGFLTDRETAAFFKTESTGSLRSQLYSPGIDSKDLFFGEDVDDLPIEPTIRMSNTITRCNNPKSLQKLHSMARVAAKTEGLPFYILLHSIHSAEVDDGNVMGFNVLGWRVDAENSRIREPFRGVHVTGKAPTILRNFAAMTNHAEVRNGECVAESGVLPVSDVAPWSLIERLAYTGLTDETDDGDSLRRRSRRGIKLRRRSKKSVKLL